jgi:hypothetical protein
MLRFTWLRWLALGDAVLVLAVAGCTGGKPKPTPTPTPSLTSQAPVEGVTAPDGGTLRVTEQGVSQIKDRNGQVMVSFGVIVENTSRNYLANNTKLTVRLTKASGVPVVDRVEHGQYTAFVTFPQHRTGLGAQVYVGAPGTTRIQVRVGPSTWAPRGNALFADIAASDVRTQHTPGSTTFSFALTSAYRRTVTGRYVNVILRDRSGLLIGGAGLGITRDCAAVPPGKSTCSIGTNYPLPAGAVDSRTEVYVSGV